MTSTVRKLRAGRLLAAATIPILLASVACSSESDGDPRSGEAGGDTAEDGTTTTGADGSEATTGDAAPGGEGEGGDEGSGEAGDEEALGSSTARLTATPDDPTLVPLRLDVVGLERLDGMVELRVTLSNEGDSRAPAFEPYGSFDDPRLPRGQGRYSLSGAALVDAGAERAYLTIVDSEGTCLCTGRLAQAAVPPGETFDMYADFGGLPDELEEVDVQVPGFPTVDGVPIG